MLRQDLNNKINLEVTEIVCGMIGIKSKVFLESREELGMYELSDLQRNMEDFTRTKNLITEQRNWE